jgi:hypothetical protein
MKAVDSYSASVMVTERTRNAELDVRKKLIGQFRGSNKRQDGIGRMEK